MNIEEIRDQLNSFLEPEHLEHVMSLITKEIKQARIQELQLIEQAQQDDDKWSNFCMDDTSDFGNYISERINALNKD